MSAPTGWVVVRETDIDQYLTIELGLPCWVNDPGEAMMLARAQDAAQIATLKSDASDIREVELY